MTWTCLECGAANPASNPCCGAAACQLRRLNELAASAATPPQVPLAQGSSKSLEPQPTAAPKKRHTYTDPDFEAFWEVYPNRKGKLAAYRKWQQFVVAADAVDPQVVIAAALRYRNDPRRDPEKTKYPEGWLSAGRWMDEYETVKPVAHLPQATDMDALRSEMDESIAALISQEGR